MKASLLVLLIGGAIVLALLFAQFRWMDAPRGEFGLRRAWTAGALVILFGALASLHALFVEAEAPPADPNLRLLPLEPGMEGPDRSPPPPTPYPYVPPYPAAPLPAPPPPPHPPAPGLP